MKKILIVAIILMAGLTTNLMAQTSSTVTGTTAGAKLIVPMVLTQTAVMHFGTVNVLAGAGGSVTLSTANVRSVVGGVALSVVAPLSTNAAYNVTGTLSTTYAIVLPATITVTRAGNIETMTIGSLVARCASTGADGLIGTLSALGADNFTVGGTLAIGAAQASGVYSGTFNVTVDYN